MLRRPIGIGHNGPPREPCPPWLMGAEARIARRERPVTTTGKAHTDEWVLRFERRTPPFIEPLMGWTGGNDTLAAQVELTFASRDEAVAYAERQGLPYRLLEEATVAPLSRSDVQHTPRAEDRALDDELGAIVWLTPVQAAYGRCALPDEPDLDRAFINPSAVFASPEDVLLHPLLSRDCKREILWRWAWDEFLIEIAQEEGMPEGPPSRLDEVRTALRRLGHEWRPHPAAPAAFAVRLQVPDEALAA